mmetsp:Transcript_62088/g.128598  ORF Transcript_62088/g.128598 Transcript_62088/m.128598 type:complete len:293 (+) Transcript_62088:1154-2032(+)
MLMNALSPPTTVTMTLPASTKTSLWTELPSIVHATMVTMEMELRARTMTNAQTHCTPTTVTRKLIASTILELSTAHAKLDTTVQGQHAQISTSAGSLRTTAVMTRMVCATITMGASRVAVDPATQSRKAAILWAMDPTEQFALTRMNARSELTTAMLMPRAQTLMADLLVPAISFSLEMGLIAGPCAPSNNPKICSVICLRIARTMGASARRVSTVLEMGRTVALRKPSPFTSRYPSDRTSIWQMLMPRESFFPGRRTRPRTLRSSQHPSLPALRHLFIMRLRRSAPRLSFH